VRAPTTAAGSPAAGPAGFAATAVAPNGLAPDGFAAPTAIATQPGVTPAGVATEGIAPDGFVESQLAGLSAIIRLAEPAATTAQHAAIALQPPPPGPPPTLPGWAAVTQARPRPAPRSLRQLPGLPLIVILTVQVVTSFRLIKSNSAFSDEALYLWAGRLEWSHWLHHTPVPPFQTYFSGSPVVYPPIGALAASVGGLTGARLLSLLFLLGATILLHGLTKRIFDRRSAHFAAALFAGLGSAQFLGAFATYDAFAILGLATATWLGIRSAGNRKLRYRLLLLIAAAIALAVADAAKYTATLFDPVVIVVIVCFHWHALGRRAAIISGATVTFVLAGGVAAALVAGGASYWTGITSTTLTRTHGNWPVFGILYASAGWTGPVLVLAIFGAMATSYATRSGAARTLAWTLVAAGLLAPAEQARIQVFTSLFKHVAFGCWFAAPVAGYALTAFIRVIPAVKTTQAVRVCLTVVIASSLLGVLLAANHFGNWNNVSPAMPTLSETLAANPGRLLTDDAPPADYYLEGREPWQDIASVTAMPAWQLAQAVKQRQFSVIVLSFATGGGGCGNQDPLLKDSAPDCLQNLDLKVLGDIIRDGGYQQVAKIPYQTTSFQSSYLIWARQGGSR
jgi:4-amino-4-deoxy-L-arabinose transferase-like glycosyltransferase